MLKKILFSVFLFAVSVAATAAQNPEQAVLSAREQSSNIKHRSNELERMKRESSRRPVSRDFTLKFPEIKEDFEQIQKINSGIAELTAAKKPIDYTAVIKLVSEIKQRAVRLEANLFSVEPSATKEARNKQPAIEQKELETLLDLLDKSVYGFAHSSMFQNTNLVNSEDSLKAQKDLEKIIEISSLVKEKAKRLKKDNSKK